VPYFGASVLSHEVKVLGDLLEVAEHRAHQLGARRGQIVDSSECLVVTGLDACQQQRVAVI
jgi:hypothetical protein